MSLNLPVSSFLYFYQLQHMNRTNYVSFTSQPHYEVFSSSHLLIEIYPFVFVRRGFEFVDWDTDISFLILLYYHILEIVKTLFYHQTNVVNQVGCMNRSSMSCWTYSYRGNEDTFLDLSCKKSPLTTTKQLPKWIKWEESGKSLWYFERINPVSIVIYPLCWGSNTKGLVETRGI